MKLTLILSLLIVATLAGATIKNTNIQIATKENLKLNFNWWLNANFYQIYPRSFKDSNNDGIGDLQGITSKLEHLVDAGVDAVWLSPIYKSPQVDQGYDISDYRDIDPDYGTLDDFKELLAKAHKLGLRVILDYVPNHTSDQHVWFQNSVKKVKGFEDFYVWHNGSKDQDGNKVPPNNWISSFKGSAWTWNDERQQFFLHQFAPAQPDLNYRDPGVVKEMKDVLTFWLDLGVDGFRVDTVPSLFEDDGFLDEPESGDPNADPQDYEFLKHIYTYDQNGTFDMVYQWRELLEEYSLEHGLDARVMMTEAYSPMENIIRYFGDDTVDPVRLGAHFSFNFDFIRKLTSSFTADDLYDNIINWMKTPEFVNYNWVLGNHDNHRVASRLGVKNIDAFNMLTAVLPGVSVTYNGEEIGQEDGEVTCEEGHDPMAIKNCSTFAQVSRDFERTPFQWDSSVNAGFNKGAKPWLPVSKKAKETNLEKQNVPGLDSHYNTFKNAQRVRYLIDYVESSKYVMPKNVNVGTSDNLFHASQYFRDWQDKPLGCFTILYNVSDKEVEDSNVIHQYPGNFTVLAASSGSSFSIGQKIDSDSIKLQGRESIIIGWY